MDAIHGVKKRFFVNQAVILTRAFVKIAYPIVKIKIVVRMVVGVVVGCVFEVWFVMPMENANAKITNV
jgi:hypothetical protein